MNQQEFSALVEQTVRDTSAILIAKGQEYAGSADRLANFKRGSNLTGATALQVAFVYASKHYDSIATFVRNDAAGNKQLLSEPIAGRFDDLINYCILMKALIVEAHATRGQMIGAANQLVAAGQNQDRAYKPMFEGAQMKQL